MVGGSRCYVMNSPSAFVCSTDTPRMASLANPRFSINSFGDGCLATDSFAVYLCVCWGGGVYS